ncbi:MAG: spore coat protein [Clostridium sp.]|nr:spore coat protein [Clostridium sp.]
MQDKEMLNDVLSQTNSSLTDYAGIIAQASNPQLRQVIQQIRNSCETFQHNLYKLAEQKGYYHAAQLADQSEIAQVRNLFN